jgi:hypothetical protein
MTDQPIKSNKGDEFVPLFKSRLQSDQAILSPARPSKPIQTFRSQNFNASVPYQYAPVLRALPPTSIDLNLPGQIPNHQVSNLIVNKLTTQSRWTDSDNNKSETV